MSAMSPQVFSMAGNDPFPQLLECVPRDVAILIELLRGVDNVTHVNVRSERRPINGSNQAQILVRVFRRRPKDHLQSKFGSLRLDQIEDLATILYRGLEELPRVIPHVRPIPMLSIQRP